MTSSYQQRKRGVVGQAVLCAVAILTGGCGSRETRVDQGTREQMLHVGNLSEPRDLDPHVVNSIQDFHIMMALFEGLTGYHPQTLDPVPAAASSWTVSDDGCVYAFQLRPEARWSDGSPVTAGDFLFSWQRILAHGSPSETAYMLFGVKNAAAFNRGEIDDFSAVGFEAPDDHTLRITLERPMPYFLRLLGHQSWLPVHPPTVLKHGDMMARGTAWTRPGNFVGNGPFTLEDWQPHQFVFVRKNPNYWDAQNVRLNGIYFYPIENTDTEEHAFRAGQLHVTASLPNSKIAVYQRERPETLDLDPLYTTYFYRFNTTRPPLNDARVRRALSLAIDRETIVTKIAPGGRKAAYNLTPPGAAGYEARARLAGGVEEARRLLAEAGFPGGRGFPLLRLLYNSNPGHQEIAEAIQAMWRNTLGVEIALFNQEAKVWSETMKALDYDIARFAWGGDYPDPNSFLDMMVTGGGNNQTGWSNREYDRLIEVAAAAADPSARLECFQQAEEILMRESPIAPIYFYTRVNLKLPEVRGWYHTILDIHPYTRVYLER